MIGGWTPGPWVVDGKTPPGAQFVGEEFHRIAAGDARPAFIPDWSANASEAEQAIANAHLIAAAPDMYAALVEVLRIIKASENWWMDVPDCGGFDADAIEAVLAKARGEA